MLLPWSSCSYCSQLLDTPYQELVKCHNIKNIYHIDTLSLVPRLLPDLSHASACMELPQTHPNGLLLLWYVDSIEEWSWLFDLTAVTDIAKEVLLWFFSCQYMQTWKASSYIFQWKCCLITFVARFVLRQVSDMELIHLLTLDTQTGIQHSRIITYCYLATYYIPFISFL